MKALIFTDSTHDIGPSNNNVYYSDILDLFTPLYPTIEKNVNVPLHYPALVKHAWTTLTDILRWHFVEGATTVVHYTPEHVTHQQLIDLAHYAQTTYGYSVYQTGGEPICCEQHVPAFTLVDHDHLTQRLNDDMILTLPDNQRVIIVGDIRDNTAFLDELVHEHDTEDTRWILVGDYIDGFGNINTTLNYMLHLDPDKFILIEGNHEHNMRWLSSGLPPAPDMTVSVTNFDTIMNQSLSRTLKTLSSTSSRDNLDKLLARVHPYVRLVRGHHTYTICHGGVSDHIDLSDDMRCWIADRTFIHGTSLPYMETSGLHTYTISDAHLHDYQIIGHRNDQEYNKFLPLHWRDHIYLLEQGIMHNRGLGYVICEPGRHPEGHVLDISNRSIGVKKFRNKTS